MLSLLKGGIIVSCQVEAFWVGINRKAVFVSDDENGDTASVEITMGKRVKSE
jgi:hypothetical protein